MRQRSCTTTSSTALLSVAAVPLWRQASGTNRPSWSATSISPRLMSRRPALRRRRSWPSWRGQSWTSAQARGANRRAALRAYGRLLGLAFQIADDVLDYEGSEDEIGKPTGQDIADGFATLPLMLAMEEAQIAVELTPMVVDRHVLNADEARQVVDLVRASHGPQRALDRARELSTEATRQLAALHGGEAREALATLSNYVVSRKL